jgi:hypothetical protein
MHSKLALRTVNVRARTKCVRPTGAEINAFVEKENRRPKAPVELRGRCAAVARG